MNELAPLENFAGGLLERMAAGERRKLARRLAMQIRSSQGKRIAAQQNPDGSAYAPRKPSRLRQKKGAIRRQMFSKLRTAKWLKIQSSADAAVVAFAGRVQRIAQVHQYGLRDKVDQRGGPTVTYAARQLLGLTATEIEAIGDAVIAHLAGR